MKETGKQIKSLTPHHRQINSHSIKSTIIYSNYKDDAIILSKNANDLKLGHKAPSALNNWTVMKSTIELNTYRPRAFASGSNLKVVSS